MKNREREKTLNKNEQSPRNQWNNNKLSTTHVKDVSEENQNEQMQEGIIAEHKNVLER